MYVSHITLQIIKLIALFTPFLGNLHVAQVVAEMAGISHFELVINRCYVVVGLIG